MISIVCIYNDEEVLHSRLLRSLERQTAVHEVVTVDNRHNSFSNAAKALNYGAGRTQGSWVLFAHQDISFLSDDWLGEAERLLSESQPSGWTGVAGMTRRGAFRGFLVDRAHLLGAPFDDLMDVQTLDECLLIHKRESGAQAYFDEALEGWHAYGVEACCRAIENGPRNYVVSLPVWHDSKSVNLEKLEDAHAFVWRKHGHRLRKIYTASGTLPDDYHRTGADRPAFLNTIKKWRREKAFRLCGFSTRYADQFGVWLEAQTQDEAVVEVLHEEKPVAGIEVKSFVAQPEKARRVIHRFRGFDYGVLQSDCVVVMPELAIECARRIEDLEELLRKVRRLIICFNPRDLWRAPKLWRLLRRRAATSVMIQKWDTTSNYDGLKTATAVFEVAAL